MFSYFSINKLNIAGFGHLPGVAAAPACLSVYSQTPASWLLCHKSKITYRTATKTPQGRHSHGGIKPRTQEQKGH